MQPVKSYSQELLHHVKLEGIETNLLQLVTHEKPDTRIFFPAKDAVMCGYTTIMIQTVDSDVLVLAVAN